ncbi:RES family NAD+ phosphorylase [Tropicimonas sp. IMCC6043]|uniref:RES family NAD+ phosphorylase n=1 Tax=Tropicimonas sp. IMCC6043 TaxID=2510645 RepID=UPI00101BE505|nr:RES family NAD+ phosphorylase [Tropicimonas sp. IMCC6043]RYH09597.1 RES domain-containing protein [Tropicimonas sp. IMCC6043]
MSSPTWTADALRSEAVPYSGTAWRMVEAQHVVSTMKLVDTLEEQELLEGLIDASKPPVPEDCAHLDYLLYTPFRYRLHGAAGSRFRRAGAGPGLLYAAEHVETAAAEMAHYRMLFFRESPDTRPPSGAAQYTAFSMAVTTPVATDLTAPPLDADRAAWTDPVEYAPCQALAETARTAGIEVLLSHSVRDAEGRRNVTVLACAAFASPAPLERQSWWLHADARSARAICEFPRRQLEFSA